MSRACCPSLPPSTTLIDLQLDFARDGYENLPVGLDFAFVDRDDRTLLVMPSGTEHKVAIVDLKNGFEGRHVEFSEKDFENTAPHGRFCAVEWAVGTDCVWTNDSSGYEHYVIDIVNAKLVKTITGIARSISRPRRAVLQSSFKLLALVEHKCPIVERCLGIVH